MTNQAHTQILMIFKTKGGTLVRFNIILLQIKQQWD